MKIKSNNKLTNSKMKKQIIALSLGLITIGSFAQKNELKLVEKAIKKGQSKEARATIATLESTENSIDPKLKAKYYYLKGSAYGKSNVKKAADAYNDLFAFEKEQGKFKYTKLAKPQLGELIQFVSKKAIAQYGDKSYKNAADNFSLTYRLSPKDTSFLYNAAVSASLAKDYDVSLKYYDELKNIGYTGIATQYLAENKATGVVEDLGGKSNRNTMVKFGKYINPTEKVSKSKQPDIIKSMGYIYVNQGKPELAVAALEEARKSDPKNLNLILSQADMYIKLDKMDKFGELMVEAVKLNPTNPTLFFNLGVVNANENKIKEAIGFYNKAIELKPDYADAYMNLYIAIISEEKSIVDEMNKNLNNFKKYDELEGKQKELYKKALPSLEKADSLDRSFDSVKSLLNLYDILEMNDKADALRPIYKEMRSKQ
jgi:tetratricopeptide (TPR) repeat protein